MSATRRRRLAVRRHLGGRGLLLRLDTPCGRDVPPMFREQAGKETGVQLRRVALVDGDLGALQRLNEPMDQVEDLSFAGGVYESLELGSHQLNYRWSP